MQAGALFLQNRRFRFESKNRLKNHRNLGSEIQENLKKSIKKTSLQTCSLLTSFLVIFGTILPPKLEAKIIDFSYFFVDFPK